MTDESQEKTQEIVPLQGLDRGFRAEIRHRVENAPNIEYITGLDKLTVLDLLSSLDHLIGDGYLKERDAEVVKLRQALGHIGLWVAQTTDFYDTQLGRTIHAEIEHVLEGKS